MSPALPPSPPLRRPSAAWVAAWAWVVALFLLWLPGLAAAAGGCSPYMGQVVINEVRIGKSNSTDVKNQLELYNTAGVAAAVWQTWTVVAYGGDNLAKAVKRGTYPMASGFTANGPFIYNNVKKMWARNGDNSAKPRASDFAVFDASGDIVAYLAVGVGAQVIPACYGSTTTIMATAGGDNTGSARRATDGNGAWPAQVPKTNVHTIGRTNECSAGADVIVNHVVDYEKAVRNSTTVTFTITAYNNACSVKASNVEVQATYLSTTDFSSLSYSASSGSGSINFSGTTLVWDVNDLNAGVTRTLTVTGIPKNLGTLTSVATVTKPTTGLINTGDDSDSASLTVYPYNYVGFDIATDSATEGTQFALSPTVVLYAPSAQDVTVNYSVAGTAGSGDTNLPASGSVVILAGTTEAGIDFTITNDSAHEPTETIVLTITGVSSGDSLVRIGTTGNGDILTETITLFDDDPPDHYELVLASSSLSCLPSTVTVKACSDSSSPCTNPSTALNGATITLAASAGSLGATSISFNGAGVASTTLSHPAASDGASVRVTLSNPSVAVVNSTQCCPDGASCATRAYCDSTFNTAGFIVSASAGGAAATVPAQTAGTASAGWVLRAVKTGTTTKACEAALSGATTVNWAYQCNNPTTCSAGNLMSINGGSATTIQRNDNGAALAYTAVPMTFDANGNAPFSFTFGDVGQVRLWAAKSVNAAPLAGSSNAFVVRPAGFTVTGIAQAASPNLANPAAASAAGAKFVKAGESFRATVTATTSTGAAAPNFGRETSPEGVLLTPTLVLPAGGVAGTLANGSIAGGGFSSGAATVSNLAYSEVGIITLAPSLASGSYLGAGNVSGTTTGNIGRFVPSHFALTTGTPVPGCSASFTYFGQDGFTTPFTLIAQNTANAVTQNYAGSFAKLGLTSWSSFGFSAAGLPAGSALAAGATAPSGNWALGTATISAMHQVSRPSAATAETGVTIRATPLDSDGVTMATTAVGAATPLRYGRLRLSNAFGSARAALQVPVSADYWSGSSWVLNSADSCSTLPAASIALSNPRDAAGNASATTTSASAVSLAAGQGLLTLAAPSPAGSSFSVDLAVNLGSTAADQSCQASHPATTGAARPWLRGRNGSCAASDDRDPAARATFGIFSPESRKTVHVRQIF